MRRALFIALGLAACRPDFGERASLVTKARVIAVRAEPAEAAPGAEVAYTALVAAPEGTRADPSVAWAFCASPKPLTENDVVSADCLGAAVRSIGVAPQITAAIPGDACALFGPETPPGGFRPRDADVTGGFYQPVRAFFEGAPAIALSRVTCNLGNASADVAADFKARYRANVNPAVGVEIPAEAARGARITLRAAWRDEDAESYVSFDPAAQAVVPRREAMQVSWFATSGAFDADRTGRAEDDVLTSSDNGWIAPETPGTAHLWIVLRDSRGGVATAARDVTVR